MSTVKTESVCGLMRRFISVTQQEIARKRRDISRTQDEIRQAQQRPQPNHELIAALAAHIERTGRDLADDMNALQVLEEEFSAQCL
jgi:septal ring factor EnvC (AmiA/AmiB activator)